MKITRSYLKQIIKEELENINEGTFDVNAWASGYDFRTGGEANHQQQQASSQQRALPLLVKQKNNFPTAISNLMSDASIENLIAVKKCVSRTEASGDGEPDYDLNVPFINNEANFKKISAALLQASNKLGAPAKEEIKKIFSKLVQLSTRRAKEHYEDVLDTLNGEIGKSAGIRAK